MQLKRLLNKSIIERIKIIGHMDEMLKVGMPDEYATRVLGMQMRLVLLFNFLGCALLQTCPVVASDGWT